MIKVDSYFFNKKTNRWELRKWRPVESKEERKARLERLKDELERARIRWIVRHPGHAVPKYLYDSDVDDIDPDPYRDYRDDWKEMAEEGAQFSWMDY